MVFDEKLNYFFLIAGYIKMTRLIQSGSAVTRDQEAAVRASPASLRCGP